MAAALPKDFGYVILASSAVAFQTLTLGMRYAGSARRAITETDDYKQRLKDAGIMEQLEAVTGKDSYEAAYPDMGNGRLSSVMTMQEWMRFNLAQRAHYQALEFLPPTLLFGVFSGLAFPKLSASMSAAYIVARELYSKKYTEEGPKKRVVGAIAADLAVLVLFGASVCAGWKMAGVSASIKGLLKRN